MPRFSFGFGDSSETVRLVFEALFSSRIFFVYVYNYVVVVVVVIYIVFQDNLCDTSEV